MCVGTPLNRKATPRVLGVERTVYNVGENILNRGKATEVALLLLLMLVCANWPGPPAICTKQCG